MGKPSDSPGFKKLLEEWNQRLAQSGFKDIERPQKGELSLKRPGTTRRFEEMDSTVREAKVEFFRLIAQNVAETQFETPFEAEVLSLYARGYKQSEIHKCLGIQGHRCHIYEPIYKYLRRWGLK